MSFSSSFSYCVPHFKMHLLLHLLCFSAAVMTQTVQTNGVQPLSKTWELSLYELQRTPQVAAPYPIS